MNSQKSKKSTLPLGKQEQSDCLDSKKDDKLYNGLLTKHGYIIVVMNMVSKDQAIGGLIFLVCVVVAIGYIVILFGYDLVVQPLLNLPKEWTMRGVQFWLIAIPVLVAFVAVLAIGAWIGWTMATTPPPKPIEEFEVEEKEEEKKEE
jgi:TRAP-type C4-dicarboxylate transport system permease small subunit